MAADPFGLGYGVFVRGADGALWARYGIAGTTRCGPWVRGGGRLLPGTAPAAAYDSLGDITGGAYVVAVGTDRRVYESTGGGIRRSLGGRTTSSSAVTAASRYNGGTSPRGTVVVFVRGTDNTAWYDEVSGRTPGATCPRSLTRINVLERLVLQEHIDDHTHPTCGDGVGPKTKSPP